MTRAVDLRQGDVLADGRVVFSAIPYNRRSVALSFYEETSHHNAVDSDQYEVVDHLEVAA